MQFQLLPVLETMIQFYQQPQSFNRFQAYLKLLQGNTKGDLIMPIGGFNPMAKKHVFEKLIELKQLNIEAVINEALEKLNAESTDKNPPIFKVAFNIADDLMGGWTNRFTTDYDNKFKLNALVKRRFCTPIFWSSENYSPQIIMERTLEYCYRTIYWITNVNPKTLEEHILQEVTIAKKINNSNTNNIDFELLNQFFNMNKISKDYLVIFNFLYGDAAIESLGNNPLGIKEPFAGFKYANWLANKK